MPASRPVEADGRSDRRQRQYRFDSPPRVLRIRACGCAALCWFQIRPLGGHGPDATGDQVGRASGRSRLTCEPRCDTTDIMRLLLPALLLAATLTAEDGFKPLFNGKNLDGWTLVNGKGPGYLPQDGMIVCPADGGGNLFTEKEYANFILRLEYRISPAGNNGVGIRAPLKGDSAYSGMELQLLDDGHEKYKGRIRPEQHTASIYDVFPSRTGFQKPAGEWNEEE